MLLPTTQRTEVMLKFAVVSSSNEIPTSISRLTPTPVVWLTLTALMAVPEDPSVAEPVETAIYDNGSRRHNLRGGLSGCRVTCCHRVYTVEGPLARASLKIQRLDLAGRHEHGRIRASLAVDRIGIADADDVAGHGQQRAVLHQAAGRGRGGQRLPCCGRRRC